MEDSAEAEGVVPTDSDGAEASQVGHHPHLFYFFLLLFRVAACTASSSFTLVSHLPLQKIMPQEDSSMFVFCLQIFCFV